MSKKKLISISDLVDHVSRMKFQQFTIKVKDGLIEEIYDLLARIFPKANWKLDEPALVNPDQKRNISKVRQHIKQFPSKQTLLTNADSDILCNTKAQQGRNTQGTRTLENWTKTKAIWRNHQNNPNSTNNLSLKNLTVDQSHKQLTPYIIDRTMKLNQASSTNLLQNIVMQRDPS